MQGCWLSAGGQGLDLSAASIAIFVELPPDVSWCRQAEDRLHRRGQQRCVNVYYLVGHAHSQLQEDHAIATHDFRRSCQSLSFLVRVWAFGCGWSVDHLGRDPAQQACPLLRARCRWASRLELTER